MIRNIIFDIGNVLMEYRWLYPFEEFGLSDREAKRVARQMMDDTWRKLDLGVIDQEEAKREFREKYPEDADACDYFIDHMAVIRVDRPKIWEKLPALREAGFRLYYLSNYPKQLFADHMGTAAFMEEMDGGVVSYQIHICKPDRRIYEHLMEKYALRAEECLFFDDRTENTEAARMLGMSAVTVESREQLLREMERLLEETENL